MWIEYIAKDTSRQVYIPIVMSPYVSVVFVFLLPILVLLFFIIIWFSIGEKREWFCEKNCMCTEYDRIPVKTDTYLSLCLRLLHASLFVGVGVTPIPQKVIILAPQFRWADFVFLLPILVLLFFIIIWFSIGEKREWFCEKNCMCTEYDRIPVKTDTYLSLCLRLLHASLFVGVGVTPIPQKVIILAPQFRWADTMSYFLPH